MPIPFNKIAAAILKIGHDQAMIGGASATLVLKSETGSTLEIITQGFTVFDKKPTMIDYQEAHTLILISEEYITSTSNIKNATTATYNSIEYKIDKWEESSNTSKVWKLYCSKERN